MFVKLQSVQALRAVAALLVVLYHLTESHFFSGAAGVDIFFVISGFIIGTIEASENPRRFIIKRLIRIIPLYWAVTSLFCIGAIIGIFNRFSFDILSLVKSLMFIPYFNSSGNIWPLVIAGWTLNIEVLFYVIFAIGIAVGRPLWLTTTVILCLVLGGVIFVPLSAPLKLWTSPIMLEFIFGLFIARIVFPFSFAVGLFILLAGVAIFAWAEIYWNYTDFSRPAVWGGAATLVVWGSVIIERAGYWPNKLLDSISRIGDVSYSLYMVHSFAVALVLRKFGSGLPACFLGMSISIIAAFACFHAFERPAGKILNRAVGNL
ncbi:acyltransferase family protein [Methylobacterium sp. HMF5984]|uniref:acyltransferase family protein n=1 Tax=Methylobacterium sp. HMF5984 TaxID=3367370 RepID=UPI003853C0A6